MGLMSMTKDEREAFLAEARVGVLAVTSEGAPLLTPIWYSYFACIARAMDSLHGN